MGRLTYSCNGANGTVLLFDEGKVVADLSVAGRVESGPLDFDEQVERARLIAKSPELYEAAQRVLIELQETSMSEDAYESLVSLSEATKKARQEQ